VAQTPPEISREKSLTGSLFRQFLASQSAGGIVLMVATVLAMVIANSPFGDTYHHVWELTLSIGIAPAAVHLTLHEWVNDGLMAIFFFLMGLEIKRELVVGELATLRRAALPLAAALGGMLAPALLYASVNARGPGASGWAVPMETDIAFALGVLALLGARVPVGLKVFLTALAIVDDLAGIGVIAIYYTASISWGHLGVAAGLLAIAAVMSRVGVRQPIWYLLIALALWWSVLSSGVHATVVGILLALIVPARAAAGEPAEHSPLERLEHGIAPWVAFLILPIFALSNAGVSLAGSLRALTGSAVASGVVLGLLVGKPLGITLASWLAVRAGVAELPTGTSWRMLHGAGWLGGIGFTMALFIAGLAFNGTALLAPAKLAILGASVVAAVIGWTVLRTASASTQALARLAPD